MGRPMVWASAPMRRSFSGTWSHREERVMHLFRLREQQDISKGFKAFIALPFHPKNTPLDHLPGPTGVDILKTIATARLMLDNIDHIKAYWVMLGPKLTQTALHFGADDLEGTIVKERIAHQAGAATAIGLTRKRLVELIEEAGWCLNSGIRSINRFKTLKK